MRLMETIDINRENLTKNNEKFCGKLWIFLMLEQVMHDFKLGCKLLRGVLWFLCSELFILTLDKFWLQTILRTAKLHCQ
jgi:hypothetical protein